MIWRWHFYAGLFVMPFILLLSVTGAIYLFKPQIDRWEERSFQRLPMGEAVSPNIQLGAAMAAFPGAEFESYRLPERDGDAAAVRLKLSDGASKRDVFISPQGKVIGHLDPKSRITRTVAHIHSELLAGHPGSWLVELAASWAIVMVLTGLYLWWPSGRRLAGVLWPRLSLGKRAFWRDLHAVTGFWVSGFALVLLVTAMPWAGVWGETFKMVREQLQLTQGKPDWKIGSGEGEHGEHDHAAMLKAQAAGVSMTSLADMVARAKAENLPYPALVKPPGTPIERGGPPSTVWTVTSEAQNRPLNRTITYDMATGAELSRTNFADKHPIDRAVNYGVAWHEGQLFGWVNQLIGLLTAVALITLMISGFVMWRRRKPEGVIGAPPIPSVPAKMRGVVAIMLLLAALMPMLAASLIVLWIFDRFILPHLPRLSVWLGVTKAQPA